MKKQLGIVAYLCSLIYMLCSCDVLPATQPAQEAQLVRLTVLAGESTSDPGMAELLQERIEAAFPQVELEWENVDWGEKFSKRLNAILSSGEIPDIIIGKAQDVAAFYPTGALGAFPDKMSDKLVDEAVRAGTVQGELYGLVYNQLYQGVLYNKNIFYRYNFTPPNTPEALQAIVERLASVGITPFASHFQETWYTGNILMQFAIGEVFSKTPDWGDRLRAGEVSFRDMPYRGCAQQVMYQFANTWPDAMKVMQNECDLRFADEQAAMYVSGTWSIQTLQSIAPYREIGIFPYPNASGDANLICEPNITFMKSASSPHSQLIDDIFWMLLDDVELAQSICAFTQTDTCLKDVEVDSLSMIRRDIETYREQGRMVSASVGNDQLVWAFQYDCAELLLSHMRGERTLDEVLAQWDTLRHESGTQDEFANLSK